MNKKKTKKATKRLKITENIILTAGGTGGHIVPAMKIASDLIAQGKTVFFITDKRFTNYEKLFKNYSFFSSKKLKIVTIPVTSFSASKTSLHFLKDCLLSFFITLVTFFKARPKIVIGFGSYVSFFPVLMSVLTFRTLILHEQNIILGKVNRFFARFAKAILLSFPDISYFSEKEYKLIKNKLLISGLPTFISSSLKKRDANYKVIHDVTTKNKIVIVITGGGQGASFFSQNIPPALITLAKHYPKKQFVIYQQVRKGEIEDVLKIYTDAKLNNVILEIKPLFENMPEILSKADFAIIRGGAASIIETALSKVFPIIIPMPNSADNHQVKNASVLARNNAAVMLMQQEYTYHKLFLILTRALNDGLFYFPIINTASEFFKNDTSQIFANVILYDDLKHLKL